jgi:tRNA-specific 2-thiouridylase
MKKTVAVALSGGIDSLVSACLLSEMGYDVIGIHFVTGFEPLPASAESPSDRCRGIDETIFRHKADFARIERHLGIRVEVVDISAEFRQTVVDYFISAYASGRTPNPCLVCNRSIKFKTILNFAKTLGAEKLATGHYAGIREDENGLFHLFRGMDPVKDQSYFLAFLTQSQLAAAVFPLGGMKKKDVISWANSRNLAPVHRSESQDICFIQDATYGDFLSRQADFKPRPGLITDIQGRVLGSHKGLHLYTIGQRRGINCPAADPYYVVRMDPDENLLVVGSKDDLLFSGCRVAGINWIGIIPEPSSDLYTQVRYRHGAVKSRVIPVGTGEADVVFHHSQSAITPGQGAVFYRNDEVLGGGFIEHGA